jgi:hypothetical protein
MPAIPAMPTDGPELADDGRRSVPTRRAFLIAGGMFVVGAGTGGLCGHAAGRAAARASRPDAPAAAAEPEPSGDTNLDELRHLATEAPLARLIELRLQFLVAATRDYRKDRILWRGVDRLCEAVLTMPDFPERRLTARLLAQAIEFAEPAFQEQHTFRLPALRDVR